MHWPGAGEVSSGLRAGGAMRFDTIIVGGGTAGCVLAHRLSADPSRRVLLCEAGRDLKPGQVPDDIRSSYPGIAYINGAYLWKGLTVRSIGGGHNEGSEGAAVERGYQQARILGGGSAINGQMANWGVPTDYDEWERLGAAGWNWQTVAPYFRKVERDLDFPGDGHGHEGRIAVRRIFPEHWSEHAKAAAKAFEQLGYTYLADQNGDFGDGYFPLAHSNENEERVSAATTYLDEETRRRPNLAILTETEVVDLTFEGTRCTGVRLASRDGEKAIGASEVILSAGAIHSPAILMRSGIGPGPHLMEKGIGVIHHAAGVGQNLMDHPQVGMGAFLKPFARMNGHTGRHILMGMRYSSGAEGAPAGDMFVGCIDRTAWHDVGKQLGALVVWINKTFSRDGEVRLRSGDWRAEPSVNFRLLSDPRDMDRLVDGLRLVGRFHMTEAMRAVAELPFPACYTDRAKQVGLVSTRNRILTGLMARLLDGPAALRRALMKRFVMSMHDFEAVMHDDDAAKAFIHEAVAGIFHASCTCRMGAAGDQMAVTDSAGRVHGVDGVRVVDASVFPSVPSANTNLPVFMVAEKISDAILAQRAS
jgi:5-(hydroxymethyl)furfural/furfural oxidase